jgi:hypothetical protein
MLRQRENDAESCLGHIRRMMGPVVEDSLRESEKIRTNPPQMPAEQDQNERL